MNKKIFKSPYTFEEWKKIKKLDSVKGKICKTAEAAKKHITEITSGTSCPRNDE